MEYLVIGVIAGILSGLFGIGGGIIIVPALLLITRMNPETAVGTSLASLLLPVGGLGAYRYYRDGLVEIRPAVLIAVGLFLGAWLGARLALKLPAKDLQRAFAVLLVFVAWHLWYTTAWADTIGAPDRECCPEVEESGSCLTS